MGGNPPLSMQNFFNLLWFYEKKSQIHLSPPQIFPYKNSFSTPFQKFWLRHCPICLARKLLFKIFMDLIFWNMGTSKSYFLNKL